MSKATRLTRRARVVWSGASASRPAAMATSPHDDAEIVALTAEVLRTRAHGPGPSSSIVDRFKRHRRQGPVQQRYASRDESGRRAGGSHYIAQTSKVYQMHLSGRAYP
jgi:hypothetical protein